MAKSLLLLSCLLFFVSCNQSDCKTQSSGAEEGQSSSACPAPAPDPGPGPTPIPDPNPTPEPTPGDGEVPPEAAIFEVSAELFKFDASDEDKVLRAFEIIKKVVASEEFKNRVINYSYKGQKKFVDNNGLTNEQIYQKILSGSEVLSPELDHEMDLELELYYSAKSTIGYTYASKPRIFMNTKYFDVYTPAEVARNVFHEWTHKLGFSHASSNTTGRSSSVPYAIGSIMEELGKKYE